MTETQTLDIPALIREEWETITAGAVDVLPAAELAARLVKARREGRALSAVMVDLDRFKRVNDAFGHRVGDEVLVEAADRLRQSCRLSDLPARWGGEEFLILLPDTRRSEARAMAERVRALFAEEAFPTSSGLIPVTASLGVAQLAAGEGQVGLLQRADEALYRSKRSGRNRVRCG